MPAQSPDPSSAGAPASPARLEAAPPPEMAELQPTAAISSGQDERASQESPVVVLSQPDPAPGTTQTSASTIQIGALSTQPGAPVADVSGSGDPSHTVTRLQVVSSQSSSGSSPAKPPASTSDSDDLGVAGVNAAPDRASIRVRVVPGLPSSMQVPSQAILSVPRALIPSTGEPNFGLLATGLAVTGAVGIGLRMLGRRRS
jgi:hypothetical protein